MKVAVGLLASVVAYTVGGVAGAALAVTALFVWGLLGLLYMAAAILVGWLLFEAVTAMVRKGNRELAAIAEPCDDDCDGWLDRWRRLECVR